ncbi:MAG: sodium/proton-translocating pyrophosphatase [Leptospiraceae bacterium]|nr:sodium/proton-translocating pyrophosphatase [Leptospiraceae bacterium]
MYNVLITVAAAGGLLSCLLCILQITKRLRLPGGQESAAITKFSHDGYQTYLRKILVLSALVYACCAGLAYYLEFVRHGITDHLMLGVISVAFLLILGVAWFTDILHRRMDRRVQMLQKASMSRLFRHFLYAGALLGLGATLIALGYIVSTERLHSISAELLLLPAYGGALVLYWLRFNVSLIARSSDYAFELMGRQEATLPLVGQANPLWRLRQNLASVNRFFFYHLEYLILCLVVLLIATQVEAQTKIFIAGKFSISILVFAMGIISAIPAFFIMRVRDKTSPETFLWNIRIGYIAAISIQAVIAYFFLVVIAQIHIKYFWIIFLGSLTAFLLNVYSAIYVAENHKTARSLIAAAASSVSTVIHRGIASGMRGAAIPALIIAAMMSLVYLLGVIDERGENRFGHGLFALSLALTSMVSLFIVAQATAVIMPLASTTIGRIKLEARRGEKNDLLEKFRNLRSVSVPSYVLHGKIMFSALAILIFLVYAQILSDAGAASLFKHLTQTAMLLIGAIASYFLSARINELVLNLGPLLVRETSRQFREIPGLTSAEVEPDMRGLWQIAVRYLTRKVLPLFIGTMALPAFSCLLGGTYGLAGYLIGFGFFTFLNGNSWLTSGAAWSSARHAAEADSIVTRHTAQLEALVQADIVGDSMHEAAAPTLTGALTATIIGSLLFTPATLELHEKLRDFVKTAF